jgi:hypothetical protein
LCNILASYPGQNDDIYHLLRLVFYSYHYFFFSDQIRQQRHLLSTKTNIYNIEDFYLIRTTITRSTAFTGYFISEMLEQRQYWVSQISESHHHHHIP